MGPSNISFISFGVIFPLQWLWGKRYIITGHFSIQWSLLLHLGLSQHFRGNGHFRGRWYSSRTTFQSWPMVAVLPFVTGGAHMGLDLATSKWWVSSKTHFESFHLSCFPNVSHQSLATVNESLVTRFSALLPTRRFTKFLVVVKP